MNTFADRTRAILSLNREEALAGFPHPVPIPVGVLRGMKSRECWKAMCVTWCELLGHDRFRVFHSLVPGTGFCLWFANELEASQAALTGLENL